VCQVCHTRTGVHRRNVANETHGEGTPCSECHRHADGHGSRCGSCHGDRGRALVAGASTLATAAPPKDASGVVAETDSTVGEHLAHVNRGTYRTPLECDECHLYADYTNVGTHGVPGTPRTAEVSFGPVATSNGVIPRYLETVSRTATCESVYCHGATLPGGTLPAPPWTTTAQAINCQSCHASPPPLNASSPHPLNTTCTTCHGTGYALSTIGGAARDTHVDGSLQVLTSGCTACHGDLAAFGVSLVSSVSSAAPGAGTVATSVDVAGASGTTRATVGAHLAHAEGTTELASPVGCGDCHPVPANDGDLSHATGGGGGGGARATIQWSAVATGAAGAADANWTPVVSPSYSGGASPTCTGTY
jgi:predicted CxxxxCH...CXXCH cytochrome family protein